MASKFRPNADDLRAFVASNARSEKKFKKWSDEAAKYNGLYVNDKPTLNENSPGGNQALGSNETTTVVRNAVGTNVFTRIRRLSIKDALFGATPMESLIQRDTPFGPVLVDSESAAQAQSEILTYGFHEIGFTEQFVPVLEDNEIANFGCMKLVSWDGADAPETQVWEKALDTDHADTQSGKVKSHKPVNSLANARFPGLIWVSRDDIILDADAVMRNEVNSVTHRIVKPIENMRSQEVDDYELVLDPKSGKLKRQFVIDPETGNPKRRKKYENLEGLQGNYQAYLDKKAGFVRKKGDIRNETQDGWTDKDPKDYLVYFERNGRFPADSGVVVKEFGGVPKTIDGFVYFMVRYVENTQEGSDEAPTLLSFDWYPVDLGQFTIDYLQLRPKAGSQRGFSDIRNYYEAMALENYWDSYDTLWYAAVKPEKIWNKRVVDPESIKAIQSGGHYDNVMADMPQGSSPRDACYITEFSDRPQGVDMLKARMRQIQDEAIGMSANQRLQGSNQSATQSSLIQQNADDQIAFDIEIIKDFIERRAQAWMRLFVASLPESGRFEIPGSEGGFVKMDRMQLDIACAFTLTYASFSQAYNPVVNKQAQEFIAGVVQTPPQLWDKMRPFWKFQASQFPPALMSAYREFEKAAFGSKPQTDPDQEQALMREGIAVEPDPNENFVDTIPKHQKMLQEVTTNPMFSGWNQPARTGKVPTTLLAQHYAKSVKLAEARGMGPALGLGGDKAGMQAKDRGSAPGSGRVGQATMPDGADISAGAESIPSAMGT